MPIPNKNQKLKLSLLEQECTPPPQNHTKGDLQKLFIEHALPSFNHKYTVIYNPIMYEIDKKKWLNKSYYYYYYKFTLDQRFSTDGSRQILNGSWA